ncbi:MAG TPA: DUF935 family protein [Thermoanaerobaculaceae bacterium]|nr:DUF935 family protein [Thermoanaerobaculaceae bacterium]
MRSWGQRLGGGRGRDSADIDPIEGLRYDRRERIPRRDERPRLVPAEDQHAAQFNAGMQVQYSRFDEALRDSWTNALSMRLSEFVEARLSARKYPVTMLPWRIEVDNPKHPDQARAAALMTKLVERIPRYRALRHYLGEAPWQGKYGAQLRDGAVTIDGRERMTVVAHEPVDGDTIVYKFDGTPGILIRSAWQPPDGRDSRWVETPNKTWIQPTDRALALFLGDPTWRDRFIIHEFVGSSSDFMFEGDKLAGVHGVGLRSRLYWGFRLREKLRKALYDALYRVGTNGMNYGWYPSGNTDYRDEVVYALKCLGVDNVSAFPYVKGEDKPDIGHIEPSPVGYDVLFQWIGILEEHMTQAILGQTLSSGAESTGMGSEVADLHRSTQEHILRLDAGLLDETTTRDLLGPLTRWNEWEYRGKVYRGSCPFGMRYVSVIDKAQAQERSQIIFGAYDRGLKLDSEEVYNDLGLTPPKEGANLWVKPDAQAGAPGPAPPGGPPRPPGVPGAPRPGLPGQPPDFKGRSQVAPRGAIARPQGGPLRTRPVPLPTVTTRKGPPHAAPIRP